jgi:hypothetical protein
MDNYSHGTYFIEEEVMQDIEKLMLRLKKEKEDAEKEDAAKVKVVEEDPYEIAEKKGFLAGIEDAYKMKYTEFLEFLDFLNVYTPYHLLGCYASRQTKEKLNTLQDYVYFNGENCGEFFELTDAQFNALANDIFCEGWTDGVLHIWNQVKDKLD